MKPLHTIGPTTPTDLLPDLEYKVYLISGEVRDNGVLFLIRLAYNTEREFEFFARRWGQNDLDYVNNYNRHRAEPYYVHFTGADLTRGRFNE